VSLIETGVNGGAYIGVGPEQNFHYIAAIRPKIVFQLDIRRQAVIQHLMYKAIFELSADRADFLSLLMSRPRPAGLQVNSAIAEMLAAFHSVPADAQLYSSNLTRIQRHLLNRRGMQLDSTDLASLTYVYGAFYRLGPNIAYSGRSSRTNFGTLAGAVDALGTPRSFLGSDENFRFIKEMHGKNLIIPVVADFAGPSAIRSIADYLARRNTKVSAFYVSNVETYLFRNGVWGAFYSNVATLPVDSTSVFIRPSGSGLAPVIIVDGRILTAAPPPGGAATRGAPPTAGSPPSQGGRVAGLQILSGAAMAMSPNALCPIQAFIRAYLENRITTVRHATQCNR
jgi:hypothetical protein